MIIDYTEILQSAEFVIFLRISYRLSLVCPLELTMILSSEWPYQQGDHLGRAKISWRLAALIFFKKEIMWTIHQNNSEVAVIDARQTRETF